MTKITKSLLVFLSAISIIFLFQCAPIAVNQHFNFIPNNVSMIHKGMTQLEIEGIFGSPDIKYEDTFGENTDLAWKGLVYKYHIVRDPKYQYVVRYRTNTFVFFLGTNPPKLNHWHIEHVYEDKAM